MSWSVWWARKVDDAPGMKVGIDGVPEDVVAEAGVTGDGVDAQVGIEGTKLEQLSGGGVLLPAVGGQEVIEEDKAEATEGVGQLEGEAAVAIASLT